MTSLREKSQFRISAAQISAAQARRIALAAQGFGEPLPAGRVGRRHLRRAIDRMGLIQIDSVNVPVRGQELPWPGLEQIEIVGGVNLSTTLTSLRRT